MVGLVIDVSDCQSYESRNICHDSDVSQNVLPAELGSRTVGL